MLVRRDKGPVTAEIVDIIREHQYGSIDSTPEDMARPIFKSNKLIDGVHFLKMASIYIQRKNKENDSVSRVTFQYILFLMTL